MAQIPGAPKDRWDKFSIVAGFLGSVLIAGSVGYLTIRATTAANNAADKINTGSFESSLVADITAKDSQETQDVALIVLDGTIGDKQPILVEDVAERVFLDLVNTQTPAADVARKVALGNKAWDILEKHNHQRAMAARQKALDALPAADTLPAARSGPTAAAVQAPLTPTPQPTPRPTPPATATPAPGTSPAPTPVGTIVAKGSIVAGGLKASPTPSAPLPTRLVTHAFQNIVYIQYDGDPSGKRASDLRDSLQKAGFFVPAPEQVIAGFANSVRYFRSEDAGPAKQLVGAIQKYLADNKLSIKVDAADFTQSGIDVPAGQLEVWIHFEGP